jgi:hypothetical protein
LLDQTKAWNDAMHATAVEVQTHRRTLMTHTEAMTALAAQQSMHTNQEAPVVELDPVMGDAMRTLARAVDSLSQRLPAAKNPSGRDDSTSKRRAA